MIMGERKLAINDDGTISSKESRMPTIKTPASFSKAMSTTYRVLAMAAQARSALGDSVSKALHSLMEDMVRQYETMRASGELGANDIVWRMNFYARWIYMMARRRVPLGFNAEACFQKTAERLARQYPDSTSPGRSAHTASASRAPPWVVCLACGRVNEHKSPQCPVVTSSGPTSVSQNTRAAVRATIAAAPVSKSEREQLSLMAGRFYAKIDRESVTTP